MGGAHSPPRSGGVARSAGVVSSAKRCAGLTTPAAPLRWLRDIPLMAQPPLLCEEGNITRPQLRSTVLRFAYIFVPEFRMGSDEIRHHLNAGRIFKHDDGDSLRPE